MCMRNVYIISETMEELDKLFANHEGRRDLVEMRDIIETILKEQGLTDLPKNENKRIAIFSQAKQRYTQIKQLYNGLPKRKHQN